MAAAWEAALRAAAGSGRLLLHPDDFAASAPSSSSSSSSSSAPRRPLSSFTTAPLLRRGAGSLDLAARITSFVADGNALTAEGVPADLLRALPRLVEVSLARNALHSVPPALSAAAAAAAAGGAVAALHTLRLPYNLLTDAGVGWLPRSLRVLDLRGNRLARMPRTLASLPHLEELLLGGNRLTMPAPEGDVLVPRSPDDDALFLPSLVRLDLRENPGLDRLPSSVLALPRLETLDVTGCALAVLPPHLGFLPRLAGLACEGNPQRSVRQAISAKGTPAVLAYLRSRTAEGTERAFLDEYAHAAGLVGGGDGRGGGGGGEEEGEEEQWRRRGPPQSTSVVVVSRGPATEAGAAPYPVLKEGHGNMMPTMHRAPHGTHASYAQPQHFQQLQQRQVAAAGPAGGGGMVRGGPGMSIATGGGAAADGAHADILRRIEAVAADIQRGSLSGAQAMLAKRELAMLRAAEVRARHAGGGVAAEWG
jgi:hypothetical protein